MGIMMRRLLILSVSVLLARGVVCAASIGDATYGVVSETYGGIKHHVNNPGDPQGGVLYTYGSIGVADSTDRVEGSVSARADTNGEGSWWVQFGYPGEAVQTDMSAYAGGSVEFMIKNSRLVDFQIRSGVSTQLLKSCTTNTAWHKVTVALPAASDSTIDFSKVRIPAFFQTYGRGYFIVDNVVWRKAASTTGSLTATLKNISDNQNASQLTWSSVNPGGGWKAADQYIQLDLTYYQPGWGIQIYTDNAAADASPRYAGSVSSSNPVGLISVEYPESAPLPMCWRMVDVSTTTTLSIVQGSDNKLYSSQLGGQAGQYPCFVWMKDRGTPAIPDKGTTVFTPGEDYVTVWDNRGAQHAEGTWSGCQSPNYIYIGANFNGAVTPGTYRTNKLIVELFYE